MAYRYETTFNPETGVEESKRIFVPDPPAGLSSDSIYANVNEVTPPPEAAPFLPPPVGTNPATVAESWQTQQGLGDFNPNISGPVDPNAFTVQEPVVTPTPVTPTPVTPTPVTPPISGLGIGEISPDVPKDRQGFESQHDIDRAAAFAAARKMGQERREIEE